MWQRRRRRPPRIWQGPRRRRREEKRYGEAFRDGETQWRWLDRHKRESCREMREARMQGQDMHALEVAEARQTPRHDTHKNDRWQVWGEARKITSRRRRPQREWRRAWRQEQRQGGDTWKEKGDGEDEKEGKDMKKR